MIIMKIIKMKSLKVIVCDLFRWHADVVAAVRLSCSSFLTTFNQALARPSSSVDNFGSEVAEPTALNKVYTWKYDQKYY